MCCQRFQCYQCLSRLLADILWTHCWSPDRCLGHRWHPSRPRDVTSYLTPSTEITRVVREWSNGIWWGYYSLAYFSWRIASTKYLCACEMYKVHSFWVWRFRLPWQKQFLIFEVIVYKMVRKVCQVIIYLKIPRVACFPFEVNFPLSMASSYRWFSSLCALFVHRNYCFGGFLVIAVNIDVHAMMVMTTIYLKHFIDRLSLFNSENPLRNHINSKRRSQNSSKSESLIVMLPDITFSCKSPNC